MENSTTNNGGDDDKSSSKVRVLLTTANVGTLFEALDIFINPWINEFTKNIDSFSPDFIGLHMQEVGGKHYKEKMHTIDKFFKVFLANRTIQQFSRYLILIDTDFSDKANFTSLCCVYLIRDGLSKNDVKLFDFKNKSYVNYSHRKIFTGNIAENNFAYKERYHKDFFNEAQWSRKGFIQTKWKIRNQNLDLVNIHLFHDPSNLTAMKKSPSTYSICRKNALEHTIEKIEENQVERDDISYSIFGDFNFRLDLASLINDFCESNDFKDINATPDRLVCRNSENKDIFTIEPKLFKWHKESSIQDERDKLSQFDHEPSFIEKVTEFEKKFPPSYPFMEKVELPNKYSETRCPAWCDRILLNQNLKCQIESQQTSSATVYDMMGENICMGDHKPIYLFFVLSGQSNEQIDAKPVNKLQNGYSVNTSKPLDFKSPMSSFALDEELDRLYKHSNCAFVNNIFVNLDASNIDLHDNAYFKDFKYLKDLEGFGEYTRSYIIKNIERLDTNNNTLRNGNSENNGQPRHENDSGECVKGQKHVIANQLLLNDLFGKIIEHLLKSIDGLTNGLSVGETARASNHIIRATRDFLNSNLIKFKHFITYLQKTVDQLRGELGDDVDLSVGFEQAAQAFTIDKSSYAHTAGSLIVLSEIHLFMSSESFANQLKNEIKENQSGSHDRNGHQFENEKSKFNKSATNGNIETRLIDSQLGKVDC